MTNERRYSFRVAAELKVNCHLIDPSGGLGASFKAKTIDISATGVKIAVEIPVKFTRRVCIQLRSDEPYLDLLVIAKTIRAERGARGTCALKFEALSPEARRDITRYVFAQARRVEQDGGAAKAPAKPRRLGAGRPSSAEWLTVEEFAEAIGESEGYATDLLNTGEIAGAKKDWLVPAAAVGDYAARFVAGGAGEPAAEEETDAVPAEPAEAAEAAILPAPTRFYTKVGREGRARGAELAPRAADG